MVIAVVVLVITNGTNLIVVIILDATFITALAPTFFDMPLLMLLSATPVSFLVMLQLIVLIALLHLPLLVYILHHRHHLSLLAICPLPPCTILIGTHTTHHVTHNGAALQDPTSPPAGNTSILIGNGDTMNITQTGTIPFKLGSNSFSLPNANHVPSACKNLLSVAKFTKDNFVHFCFDPNRFVISDLCTGVPLFQGLYRDGLYPISLSQPQAFLTSSSEL